MEGRLIGGRRKRGGKRVVKMKGSGLDAGRRPSQGGLVCNYTGLG